MGGQMKILRLQKRVVAVSVVGGDVPFGGHVVGVHPGGCWKALTS
jgi:hypothetical protein